MTPDQTVAEQSPADKGCILMTRKSQRTYHLGKPHTGYYLRSMFDQYRKIYRLMQLKPILPLGQETHALFALPSAYLPAVQPEQAVAPVSDIVPGLRRTTSDPWLGEK